MWNSCDIGSMCGWDRCINGKLYIKKYFIYFKACQSPLPWSKLRSRAPTCSPNEPASSRSDASLEIWENSASSKSLLDTCFFLRFCGVSDDGEGLLEVREDCLDGAAIDDSLEDEGRDRDVAPLN